MLQNLHVKNLALIDEIEVEFGDGLNILTGETGAGKSIILGSVNLALGGRYSKDILRQGADYGLVELTFFVENEAQVRKLKELDIYPEEGMVLLSRRLMTGRSVSRINGETVQIGLLKEVAQILIDIHGQRDSQELLSTEKHMAFVDGFGELGKELAAYREVYKKLQEAREKLESLQMDESYKLQRQDILQYQIGEIEGAKLTPGEEEELLAQREIIRNAEKITSALGTSYQLLTGGEEGLGLVSGLEGLGEELETASRFIEELGDYREKTEDLRYELEELSSTLRGYLDDYNFDPRQLDEVESRLDLIHRLKKKYGATIQEILDYWERSAQELDELTFADERAEKLRGEVADLTGKAKELAAVLSKKRKEAGERFIQSVQQELAYLDMPGVRLTLRLTARELGPSGQDGVEFFISANPGEEPKPLSKTASGGELSRVMLSIKNVLAGRGGVGTVIFDEVDTGVSGRAAQKIGLKLAQVAVGRQVICVTHLAQVAAYAGHHSRIYKQVEAERTYTHVEVLDREERVRELARINVGENITSTALDSAREMLTLAGN